MRAQSTWGGLNGGVDRLRPGALYHVLEVDPDPFAPGVLVEGARSDHPTGMYSPHHFRPIYRPRAEIIEALKQPSPTLEPA